MPGKPMSHEEKGRVSRALALEAALLLVVADYAVRLFGFRRLVGTLGSGGSRDCDPVLVARVVAALDRRGDKVRYSCLRRGFAAAWMLRLRGFHPVLHYGVCSVDGRTRAHVWVEVSGKQVVGHDQAESYSLLASFPRLKHDKG